MSEDKKKVLINQILEAYNIPPELWEEVASEFEKQLDVWLETYEINILNGDTKGTPIGIFSER